MADRTCKTPEARDCPVSQGEVPVLEERVRGMQSWIRSLETRIGKVEARLGAIFMLLIGNLCGIVTAVIMLWLQGSGK